MIVELKQAKANFDMKYELTERERTVGIASAPFRQGDMTVHFTLPEYGKSTLYFNPNDTSWGKTLVDRMSFKVLEEGVLAGRIYGTIRKTGLLSGYPYYQVEYRGCVLEAYEVGLGREGIFLCLYEGERLVSMTEKARHVVNYQDTYTLYLEREDLLPITAMMVVYYDLNCYGDLMEISVRSEKLYRRDTKQKEILAKYDSAFIPRICERDG